MTFMPDNILSLIFVVDAFSPINLKKPKRLSEIKKPPLPGLVLTNIMIKAVNLLLNIISSVEDSHCA